MLNFDTIMKRIVSYYKDSGCSWGLMPIKTSADTRQISQQVKFLPHKPGDLSWIPAQKHGWTDPAGQVVL